MCAKSLDFAADSLLTGALRAAEALEKTLSARQPEFYYWVTDVMAAVSDDDVHVEVDLFEEQLTAPLLAVACILVYHLERVQVKAIENERHKLLMGAMVAVARGGKGDEVPNEARSYLIEYTDKHDMGFMQSQPEEKAVYEQLRGVVQGALRPQHGF